MRNTTTITVDEDVLVVTTNGIPPAEMGAHVRLLLSASFHGGSLPFEHDRLARVAFATSGEWPSIWAEIARLWIVVGDRIQPRQAAIVGRKARRR